MMKILISAAFGWAIGGTFGLLANHGFMSVPVSMALSFVVVCVASYLITRR